MVSYASDVYENARKPLEIIRAVSADQWCSELQRFFNQIKHHSNALSGKNFFIITKTLLFSMAGVLVTYELVLLQVDGKEVKWQDLIDCQ
jgi:gustatory receptor